jgi:hypothetical protein
VARSLKISIRSVTSVPGGEHEPFGAGDRMKFRGGIIMALVLAPACPSQANNQVNVLLAGLHGCCPCLSVIHLDSPASARTYDGQGRVRRLVSARKPQVRGIWLVRYKRSVKPSALLGCG